MIHTMQTCSLTLFGLVCFAAIFSTFDAGNSGVLMEVSRASMLLLYTPPHHTPTVTAPPHTQHEFVQLAKTLNVEGGYFPGNTRAAIERFKWNPKKPMDFATFRHIIGALTLRWMYNLLPISACAVCLTSRAAAAHADTYPMITYPAMRMQVNFQRATFGTVQCQMPPPPPPSTHCRLTPAQPHHVVPSSRPANVEQNQHASAARASFDALPRTAWWAHASTHGVAPHSSQVQGRRQGCGCLGGSNSTKHRRQSQQPSTKTHNALHASGTLKPHSTHQHQQRPYHYDIDCE